MDQQGQAAAGPGGQALQTAVVVDERGRYAGVLTLEGLGQAFRAKPKPEPAAVG